MKRRFSPGDLEISVVVTYSLSCMNPLEQEPRRYEYLIIFDSCSSDPDVDEATRIRS